MKTLASWLLAALVLSPLSARAILPEACVFKREIPPLPWLDGEGHYMAQADLQGGRAKAITLKVVKGIGDRRRQRTLIAEIESRLRSMDCPGVAQIMVEVKINAQGGRIEPVGFVRAEPPQTSQTP